MTRMLSARLATACAVATLAGPVLAACGPSGHMGSATATGTGGAAATTATTPVPGSPSAATPVAGSLTASPAAATSPLTPPGTKLGFGQPAVVTWVPPEEFSLDKAEAGFKMQVVVESIQKGTMADFANVDLDAKQKASTPYYVKVRITALGSTVPPKDSDPAIGFQAIDDRGQQQGSLTFFGTFQRCDEASPPAPFASQKSYESCLTYLVPGGGSIQKVQWADGPNAANEVTPYFDNPVEWPS